MAEPPQLRSQLAACQGRGGRHYPMLIPRLLGMHAGLVYCMDYVESNMDWLKEQLQPLEAGDCTVACNQLRALDILTL
jgi:hypothetical protein